MERIKTKFLISTAHIKDALGFFDYPKEIRKNLDSLSFRGLALVYLLINKQKAMKDNWIFFPEKKFIFQRISEQKSFSSFNQPNDKTVITAEISIRPEIDLMSDKTLAMRATEDLQKAGIVNEGEVYDSIVLRKKDIYPIYSLDYKDNLNKILEWMDNNILNLITCGRNGLFNYNNMDHCIDMAVKISEHLKTNGTIENMRELRKYFETYKIVD